MQSLRKNFIQLPAAIKQLFQPPKTTGLLAVVGSADPTHSKRCMDTLYGAESCEGCAEPYKLSTVRSDLKPMVRPDPYKSKDPCWQSLRRTEYKCRTDPEFLMDSFINARKKCLSDPCAWDVPRADISHYRPSDKLKRKYPRTWIKCVVKRRKCKMQCDWEPIQVERRKFQQIEKLSPCDANPCVLGAPNLNLSSCKREVNEDCPRLMMPFCKPSVVPPKCKKGGRKPSKCQKRLTKYPAFSECVIDPLPDAPPVECNCLKTPMMCQVWEYYRKRRS